MCAHDAHLLCVLFSLELNINLTISRKLQVWWDLSSCRCRTTKYACFLLEIPPSNLTYPRFGVVFVFLCYFLMVLTYIIFVELSSSHHF
jgi:hypothetical protein